MSNTVDYMLNKASTAQIADHLLRCDADFVPPLSTRVAINNYAKKIRSKAMRFEAWSDGHLVGLVAAYCNDQEKRIAYITSVSVLHEWIGKGIASSLVERCIDYAKTAQIWQISLEVAGDNIPAIKLYEKNGFVVDKANMPFVRMNRYLKDGDDHE